LKLTPVLVVQESAFDGRGIRMKVFGPGHRVLAAPPEINTVRSTDDTQLTVNPSPFGPGVTTFVTVDPE